MNYWHLRLNLINLTIILFDIFIITYFLCIIIIQNTFFFGNAFFGAR